MRYYIEFDKDGKPIGYSMVNDFDNDNTITLEKLEVDNKLLKEENSILKLQIQAMNDNQTFVEDCIIELVQEVYK